MSYDNFQQTIEKKISNYKLKVEDGYYTYYYYQALDLLDKYIFNLANGDITRSSQRLSELMFKANELHKDIKIYKNYLLSLIIDDERVILDEILSLNRNFYDNEDIPDEDKAIYFFIEVFLDKEKLKNKQKVIQFNKVLFDLDYIDYRILYILYKKYNIDLFKKENLYIQLSYENRCNSRKTLKSRLAIYCTIQNKNEIDEYFDLILNDIEYIQKIRNKDFHKSFIEELCDKFDKNEEIKFLSEDMNYKNMRIYENLFSLLDKDLYIKYQEFFDYIISKYCNYIRFNLDSNNKNIFEKVFGFNKEESILAYYNSNSEKYLEYIERKNYNGIQLLKNDINMEKDLELIIEKLKQNTHFSKLEYLFMKICGDKYLNAISNFLYNVELLDMKKVRCKIIFNFESYPQGYLEDYSNDLYYYIPEDAKELVVIENNNIIYGINFKITKIFNQIQEYTEENFKEIYEESINTTIENLITYICENSFDFKNGIKTNNLNYKFSLYRLLKYIDKFIKITLDNEIYINEDIIESIIYNKPIFKDKYENMLKAIRSVLKQDKLANKKLIKIISEELEDYTEKQKDIYQKIKEIKDLLKIKKINLLKEQNIYEKQPSLIEENLNDVMEDILEISRNKSSIQYPVFTDTVTIAYKIGYYKNLKFIKLCEEFIYDNKLVNAVIYEYMKSCYKKTYFLTDKTESVLKFINLYHDKEENTKDNLQMSLNYWIKINKYDEKFIETLKNLCFLLGEEEYVKNDIVKKSIDLLLNIRNKENYIYDLNIAQIMENIYLGFKNKPYYKCLERFLYIYIQYDKLDKVKNYSKDIISYYIKNELITDYSMTITTVIYKNKYYTKLRKNEITKFKNYLIESLKYEVFDYEKYKTLICFDKNISILNSEGVGIASFKEYNYKNNFILNLGYGDSYKINEKKIERIFIKQNEDIFLDEFCEQRDKEFKDKAISVYREKNIYNKKIVEYLLKKKYLLNDIEYKRLYMDYIDKELEDENDNYKIIFYNFTKDCTFIEEDSSYIENTIKKINQKIQDKTFEFKVFKYINESIKVMKFSHQYIDYIVNKYNTSNTNSYFIQYFSENIERLKEKEILQSFITVFKNLKNIDSIIYKKLSQIIEYVSKESSIENTIFNNIIDNIILTDFYKQARESEKDDISILENSISIIVRINKVYEYRGREIYEKVLEYYPKLIKSKSNIPILNNFIIENHKGNLENLNNVCKFISNSNKNYKFTIEEEKIIHKRALDLLNKEIELNDLNLDEKNEQIIYNYLSILEQLKYVNLNDDYYKKFKNIKYKFINGLVIIDNKYFSNKLIDIYKAFEINEINKNLRLIIVKDKSLYKILKNYFNINNLEDLYFKDEYGGYRYNTIIIKSSKILDLNTVSIYEIIDLFIEYVQLNTYLLNESFYINDIEKIEDIHIINGKIIVFKERYNIEKINFLENKKISIQKIENIINLFINVLKEFKMNKKEIYISKIRNDLISEDMIYLNELGLSLKKIKNHIYDMENLVIDKSNIAKGIKAYYLEMLNQKQIKQLIDIIIQTERIGEKEYRIICENINDYEIGLNQEIYKYIIKNYKNYGQEIRGLEKEVLAYFKNLIKYSKFKKYEINDYKIFIKCLNEKHIISNKDLERYIGNIEALE